MGKCWKTSAYRAIFEGSGKNGKFPEFSPACFPSASPVGLANAEAHEAFVDSPPANRDVVLWDDDLARFGLRVKPSGAMTYVVQYRNSSGRTRKLALGRVGVLTPEEARQRARKALGESPMAATRQRPGMQLAGHDGGRRSATTTCATPSAA